jgi:two-component system OmpR family sensor kinase/two-component system sensor histidine kinase BaeS
VNSRRAPPARPSWWPEGEPWPPTRSLRSPPWQRLRGAFVRRFAVLLATLFLLWSLGSLVVFALVSGLLGLAGAPAESGRLFWAVRSVPLLIVVLAFVLTLRALRRVATPVGEVVEAAGRLAEGDYSARVAETGPPEARALATAFNAMAERLHTNEEQRRLLLAEITHELRTPLTVIQGNLEGLLDDVYPRDNARLAFILDETQVLARLIDDLRTLALTESGTLQLVKERTDLAALVGETVELFRAQADRAGVALSAEIPAIDLPAVELDGTRIREVLANLIANALRYTPRGGHVRVTCSAVDGDTAIRVVVADTGSGIAAADLPRVFDRFYKSPDSRGAGLGLAIARSLVRVHGGEMTATSELGQGTTISFTLPIG